MLKVQKPKKRKIFHLLHITHNKKCVSTGKVEISLGTFLTKKTLVQIGESLLAAPTCPFR